MAGSPDWVELFDTVLGWTAIVGRGGVLRRLTFGHRSSQAAWRAVQQPNAAAVRRGAWNTRLAERLQAYAAGQSESFDDVRLDLADCSRFRRTVIAECRRIEWGTTVTYGQLAARAGHRRAARAVGKVMATNRVPLVVPCHRVVATAGGLGGYSARQGIEMKRRLLRLEGAAPPASSHLDRGLGLAKIDRRCLTGRVVPSSRLGSIRV